MKCFTSDWHLGHVGVLEFSQREFATIQDHDDEIIHQINATVGKNDDLYVLGDIYWSKCYKRLTQFRAKINCRKLHLIWGNHDRQSFSSCFSTARDVAMVKIGDMKVFLSHYPHAYWPSSHHGALHLYGHCHNQREFTLDTLFPGRRSMDCGVDTAKILLGEYRPFTENEIADILASRPGHDQLEFYRE